MELDGKFLYHKATVIDKIPFHKHIDWIANEIQKATGSSNIGVYLQATHGCCENRGIGAHSSLTQTTVLRGAFNEDPGTKKEFMDNIKLQQEFACGK